MKMIGQTLGNALAQALLSGQTFLLNVAVLKLADSGTYIEFVGAITTATIASGLVMALCLSPGFSLDPSKTIGGRLAIHFSLLGRASKSLSAISSVAVSCLVYYLVYKPAKGTEYLSVLSYLFLVVGLTLKDWTMRVSYVYGDYKNRLIATGVSFLVFMACLAIYSKHSASVPISVLCLTLPSFMVFLMFITSASRPKMKNVRRVSQVIKKLESQLKSYGRLSAISHLVMSGRSFTYVYLMPVLGAHLLLEQVSATRVFGTSGAVITPVIVAGYSAAYVASRNCKEPLPTIRDRATAGAILISASGTLLYLLSVMYGIKTSLQPGAVVCVTLWVVYSLAGLFRSLLEVPLLAQGRFGVQTSTSIVGVLFSVVGALLSVILSSPLPVLFALILAEFTTMAIYFKWIGNEG